MDDDVVEFLIYGNPSRIPEEAYSICYIYGNKRKKVEKWEQWDRC